MNIEIAEHGRMTESGSSLLRLIQNQDIPLLDLLVRESVQNSLDAARNDVDAVNVDISAGEFKSNELNRHFDRLDLPLNRRYPAGSYRYISIRDSNTSGLTGPIRYNDVKNNEFGNLLKLIYEISKPQQNEGSGGSWGLGKTIYFRLGIGLVIYYSRICENGKYHSRMAACLVEDETRPDALIPDTGPVKRGIAWFGKKEGKITVPITRDKEIEKVLSVFGIPAYEKKETGTTVIIPYIDSSALLDEVYAKNEDLEHRPYWTDSVEDYIKVAFQRWYAPRILNRQYTYGAYLNATVNNEKITVSSMLPAFRLIRELYIKANGGALDEDSFISQEGIELYHDQIRLRNVFINNSVAGNFVYAKATDQQLKMTAPDNNKSPFQQITNLFMSSEGGNGPVVMFTGKPGMIVGYDYDGQWTNRMPKVGEKEYVIGIFVANSENTLSGIKDHRTGKAITLEEYIRQGEKADHASWTDRNINGVNPRIIFNIQRNVINKVKKQFTEVAAEPVHKQNTGLGHALANLLLPNEDFGRIPREDRHDGGTGGGSGTGKKRSAYFRLTDMPSFSDEYTEAEFEMQTGKKTSEIFMQLVTDFRRFSASLWESENEIGKPFPFSLQYAEITSKKKVGSRAKPKEAALSVTENNINSVADGLSLTMNRTERFSTFSSFTVETGGTDYILTGKIRFTCKDYSMKWALNMKEVSK